MKPIIIEHPIDDFEIYNGKPTYTGPSARINIELKRNDDFVSAVRLLADAVEKYMNQWAKLNPEILDFSFDGDFIEVEIERKAMKEELAKATEDWLKQEEKNLQARKSQVIKDAKKLGLI